MVAPPQIGYAAGSGIVVSTPSALSRTSTRLWSRSVMSSSAAPSTPKILSVMLDVRRKLNSVRWSLGVAEKETISKSPPRFSMISSAWLISPWSKRWPCSSSCLDGQPNDDEAPAAPAMSFAFESAASTRPWKSMPSGASGERMPHWG